MAFYLPWGIKIMKRSFYTLFGVLLLAGTTSGVSALAAVPEVSSNRVIELATPNSAEKTPVISSVSLDPAGKLLAAVGDDHLVRVFDVKTGKVVYRWGAHADWIKASAFRADGSILATSGADRRIHLWDVAAGTQRDFGIPLQSINTLVCSPNGKIWAAAGFADKVWILDAEKNTVLHELASPGNDIRALSFLPNGKQLAAAGRTGVVRVWDVENGNVVHNIQASQRRIYALAYSPDGKILAAGGQQRVVHLLDAATGKSLGDTPERPGEILTLCFCNEDTLAAAGSGNVIHLWSVATKQEQCRLVGHTGSITTLAFNGKAGTLISGGYDTTVRFWDMTAQEQTRVTLRPARSAVVPKKPE